MRTSKNLIQIKGRDQRGHVGIRQTETPKEADGPLSNEPQPQVGGRQAASGGRLSDRSWELWDLGQAAAADRSTLTQQPSNLQDGALTPLHTSTGCTGPS
ncbi:hypothetical protein EYF80_062471 [Liparis tanakae]|uniref:Uncharacterized protein n=1 Tax=Liparis tanakae TaxID=230148 RepID=A0A4Z2EFA7_9TELE|nr:hypothetical protein EYF80_062471 [Liparis tanakae]